MARQTKTAEMNLGDEKGVGRLTIPAIDKAINAYERKKEKRCEASPGEVSAKRDLQELLVKHRGELPLNEEGQAFYRMDGVDYIIEEKLKRRNADEGDEQEGE